jgi:hypothetical protein
LGLQAVLVGLAVNAAVVCLAPIGHCVDSLITRFTGLPSKDWSITTQASAELGKQVLLRTVEVCSLSLVCRHHGTSLPALIRLDFKQPLQVMFCAICTYILDLVAGVLTVMVYLQAVCGKLPSKLQRQPDVSDRILQSGNSAAIAIVTLSAVVLAPVAEELVFR